MGCITNLYLLRLQDGEMDIGSIGYDVQRQVSRLDGRASRIGVERADALGCRLDSWFFRKGQVIETFRGKGIYQKALDEATEKLAEGRWVRSFC